MVHDSIFTIGKVTPPGYIFSVEAGPVILLLDPSLFKRMTLLTVHRLKKHFQEMRRNPRGLVGGILFSKASIEKRAGGNQSRWYPEN